MNWFFMMKEKGNILTGKPCILAWLKVHDKAADNEQSCDSEPGDNTEFLRFKDSVDFFHSQYLICKNTRLQIPNNK